MSDEGLSKEELSGVLREEIAVFVSGPLSGLVGVDADGQGEGVSEGKDEPKEMVRTQVYLTPQQRDFLRSEGRRRGLSMAAAIRAMVEEKMKPAGDAWQGNSLLESAVEDASFQSDGRGSVGADETIYGSYQG